MISVKPSISIPVDLTNPGQFFACCGLFELADRLWPGADAWFEGGTSDSDSTFHVVASRSQSDLKADQDPSLHALLTSACVLQFDVRNIKSGSDDSDDGDNDALPDPIVIRSPVQLVLDWWSDKSIKPWAGSMKERLIFKAMLAAIDPSNPDPMNDAKPVYDSLTLAETGKRAKKLKKREPFYFDCRRGSNAHPLDSGFSPDTHHLESYCFPVVEAMCFVGLQRARPSSTDVPNQSTYTVWPMKLPVNVIGPVVCGIAGIFGSSAFTFDNFFRTDQRKHKSYSRATRTRSNNA